MPYHASCHLEVINTRTLLEHVGKTALTLRGGPVNATTIEEGKTFANANNNVPQGTARTFDRLEEYLA